MIIDIDSVLYLNNTKVIETLSPAYSSTFGYLFIFIGIIFLYGAYTMYQKKQRFLKKF